MILTMRYKIDLWMINDGWNVRFPRIYKFYDWVLMPGGLGFRAWVFWSLAIASWRRS